MSTPYQIKELVHVFDSFAPSALREEFDNIGLLIGEANQTITKALITIDITELVVDEAIANGCDIIISHHPIMLEGIKRLNARNDQERLIVKAIKNNIAIFSAHTNADRVMNGVSGRMAEKLELTNTRILSPTANRLVKLMVYAPATHAQSVREALFEAGAGEIGNYDCCSFNTEGTGTFRAGENANPFVGAIAQIHNEPEEKIEVIVPDFKTQTVLEALLAVHPYEEVAYDLIPLKNQWHQAGYGIVGELSHEADETTFLSRLKSIFNVQYIRHTPLLGRPIKKVALCGGSGSFLLKDAIHSGADIYITGDFKYHQFFDAEKKLIIADIGHYESEQFTKELFFELLTKKLPNFALCLYKVNTNTIKYF